MNPEYGTMDDFKNLVNNVHQLGMHIIIDWVANHTSWDSKLINEHPDWFKKDKKGNIIPPVKDWTDVAGLNYEVPALRRYMINAMKFWIKETDIDGFRCDVANMVPTDFWNQARAELVKIKPVFMLAEAEDPALQVNAFDMTYAWDFHFMLNKIAKGDTNALKIDKYYKKDIKNYKPDDYRMLFTSNHDENSWKGSEYERMGKAAQTFAVLCFTFPGFPLIYTGQESAMDKRLKFFEQDTVNWGNFKLADFYTELISLKTNNKALWNGHFRGEFIKLKTNDDKSFYAFARKKEDNVVISLFNLTDKSKDLVIKKDQLPPTLVSGTFSSVFDNKPVSIKKELSLKMKPWKYVILVKQ